MVLNLMAAPGPIALAMVLGWLAIGSTGTQPVLPLFQGDPAQEQPLTPHPLQDPVQRQAPVEEVCVLAPRVELIPGGMARAVVPISRPTIFAVGAFDALRLERNGNVIWDLRAGAEGPIHGPIAWPVQPIQPGETLRLGIRPLGADLDAFASIELIGASAAVMRPSNAVLDQLGDDPAAWLKAVGDRLDQSDLALAIALLFAFEGPSGPELDALRREVFQHGCSQGPGLEAQPGLRM